MNNNALGDYARLRPIRKPDPEIECDRSISTQYDYDIAKAKQAQTSDFGQIGDAPNATCQRCEKKFRAPQSWVSKYPPKLCNDCFRRN